MDTTESSSSRRRSERINPDQLEFLLNYMQANPRLRDNKLSPSYTRIHRKREWEQLATNLNSLGGAIKDVSQWRKAWNDQKGYARNKAAKIRKTNEQTGRGRDEIVNTLNPMEESILGMTGWVAATGDLNVPEAGIPTSDPKQYNAELLTPLYDCEEVTIGESDDSFSLPACSGNSATGPSNIEEPVPCSSTAADTIPALSANVPGPSIAPNQGAKRSTLTKKTEIALKELRSHSVSMEKNTAAVERMAQDISEMAKSIKSVAQSLEIITDYIVSKDK